MLYSFEHFMTSSVINKSKDNGKLYSIFVCLFFYNKPRSASKRTSERVFVLCDRSRQLRVSVLLKITAESQSQTSQDGGSLW